MTVALGMIPALALAGVMGVIALRRPAPGLREAMIEATILAAALARARHRAAEPAAGALRSGPVLAWWSIPAVAAARVPCASSGATCSGASSPRRRRHPCRDACPCSLPVVVLAALALLSAAFAPPNNYDSLIVSPAPDRVLAPAGQRPSLLHEQRPAAHDAAVRGVRGRAPHGARRRLGPAAGAHAVVRARRDAGRHVAARPERLGGTRRAQWLACLFVVSCPIVFMQASSTKNDLVAGMWLTVSTWLALRSWDETTTLRVGGAPRGGLGACALTKGTGILFAVPVALTAAVGMRALLGAPRRGPRSESSRPRRWS